MSTYYFIIGIAVVLESSIRDWDLIARDIVYRYNKKIGCQLFRGEPMYKTRDLYHNKDDQDGEY